MTGWIGWAAVILVAVAYDAWALLTSHETLSSAVGRAAANPIAGPILFGIVAGLCFHLFIEELLPAFLAARGR